ncbi:MAG: cytidine deaminase [Bacteroidetes bacterium]|nr:cytidine deaminase [Bacteroidota bacterium]
MKQRAFTIRIAEYNQLEDLPVRSDLVERAMEAAGKAYAPYSDYHVGAAVLLENGKVFAGNNQENAAYPSGLCAERVAIFYAGAQFPDVPVVSIAITAFADGKFQEDPVTPCGACRQVLYEKEVHGGKAMEVILYGTRKIQVLSRATDLLPLPFALKPGI